MKPTSLVLLSCALLCASVQARAKTILPDACGDDSVKFEVKTEPSKSALMPPAEGKAQIVFIEDDEVKMSLFSYMTFRYGMDGTWMGANSGDSYFSVSVDPGVHHLCVSPQSSNSRLKKSIQVASFTAEAGKTYYFTAQFTFNGGGGYVEPNHGPQGGGSTGGLVQGQGLGSNFVSLTQLNDDEGKYRVKAWKLATWKSK